MMYNIELSQNAEKQLKKLYKKARLDYNNIFQFIDELNGTDNPRQQGKALQGTLQGLWRYRVGDFRIIVEIIDNTVTILVLEVDHRKGIYI